MANTCGIDNSITFGSDPSNSPTISAIAIYNGIQVSWQFPALNPQSVAYVTLYRSTSANSPGEYAVTHGNIFVDRISAAQAGTRYYYWIELTSVNGTVFSLVGPASAVAPSLTEDVLSLLEGQISASNLAAALRSEIEDIPSLRTDLQNETTGRLNALLGVESTLADLGLDITQTFAEIVTERSTRIDGQTALASEISAVAVSNGQNLAAIISEQTARVDAVSAEATARETLAVRVNVAENAIDTVADDLGTAQTQIVAAEAAITTEQTARADADGALAQDISTLSTVSINSFRQATAPTAQQGRKIGSLWTDTDNGNVTTQWNGSTWAPLENQVALDAFSAVQTIQTSISNGDFALASDITTLEASVTVVDGKAVSAQDAADAADSKAGTAQSAANTADGKAVAAQGDANTALTQSAPTTIDARIQDKLVAQVGFCLINGAPSTDKDNEADCVAAGGTWLPLAALAEAVRGVEINTPSGTVKIQDRMITYDTASVNASNALTNASNAQGTADNALSNAGSAQGTANSAISAAGAAQTAANTADNKAENAQSDVDALDTNLRAEYTLKINVDPNDPNNDNKKLIGGFGLTLENDNTLQAGFDVDRFWVGKLGDTYASANVPFVVDSNDGKVYIKDAVIQDAAITTAKIGDLQVDTLKIAGNAVSVSKSIDANSVNMIIYPDNTSNITKYRKHTTQSSTATVKDLQLNGTNTTTLFLPSLYLFASELTTGTTAYINVTVNATIGMQTRDSSRNYMVTFVPFIDVYKNNINLGIVDLAPVSVQATSCFSSPVEYAYSAIKDFRILSSDIATYQYRLFLKATSYTVDQDLSAFVSASSTNAAILFAGWIRSPSMTLTMLKR